MEEENTEARLNRLRKRYRKTAARFRTLNENLYEKYADLYAGPRGPERTRFVYFVNTLDFDEGGGCKLKVGISKNPDRRRKQLSTGNPARLLLRHVILSHNPAKFERRVHRALEDFSSDGEWFRDDWDVACRLYGRDAYRGLQPYFKDLGMKCKMEASIATHYFHYRIDLLDEHKTEEHTRLEEKLNETHEEIRQIIVQRSMFDSLMI